MPLRKKDPTWLLRNSRPILLEPFLRRLEATAVFRRVLSHLEASGLIPSSMFAYRPQQSPQQAAMLTRWLIAYWATIAICVCAGDWDESNAYCNIPRSDAIPLLDLLSPGFGDWLCQFYKDFAIHVVTPHGLTNPYQLQSGGGQGDSGGVGGYLCIRRLRHAFLMGLLQQGCRPRDLDHCARHSCDTCFTPPGHTAPLPEIGFSDDGRLLARSEEGLGHLIDITCHGCWSAGGSVNTAKLSTFKIQLVNGVLRYRTGTVLTIIGPLSHRTHGLSLVGIPVVMGESATAATTATLSRLRLIHASIHRLQPSYTLALRVVLAFAIAKLDYIYDAIPPPPQQQLRAVQRATDMALTAALLIPKSAPKCLLYAPITAGGFGVPCLHTRFVLRYIGGIYKALNSRNSLVRTTIRWLVANPTATGVTNSDGALFSAHLQTHHLSVSLPPHPSLPPAREHDRLLRPWNGGNVALVSDGSVTSTAMGWGALVADKEGILATTYGGFLCHFGTSWAAEWLGKAAAARLALRLDIPEDQFSWSFADSLSASHCSDGGRPSHSPWLDEVRIWYAALLHRSALQEAYIPAEHDHQWGGHASSWQAATHDLASQGTAQATVAGPPFRDITGSVALLLHKGLLAVDTPRLLDALYNANHLIPLHIIAALPADEQALSAWRDVLTEGNLPAGSLRLAYWLRGAPSMHTSETPIFHCPLCHAPVLGWGTHLRNGCPLLIGALLHALSSTATLLHREGWQPNFTSCTSLATMDPAGRPCTWLLLPDDAPHSLTPAHQWDVIITWSGLTWAKPSCCLPSHLRRQVISTHLTAADTWLRSDPETRWARLTVSSTPPLPPPPALMGTILCHVLQLSHSHLHGPLASLVGGLSHHTPPPSPEPHHLYLGEHAPAPQQGSSSCISVLQPPGHSGCLENL